MNEEDTIKPEPLAVPTNPANVSSQGFATIDRVLAVDKPAGISSAAAVSRVKRLLPRGPAGQRLRVGHAGTLDPFATGVLLVLIGKATKRCETLMSSPKEYEATIKFGATTETDDIASPERPVDHARPPTIDALRAALLPLAGEVLQMPPVYSALKIGGQRACDRARAGETVTLQPRKIRIDSITLLDYAWPLARIHVACGRGTYVRAIARDIGAALGVGGYLTRLRRTRVGDFTIDNSVTIEALPDAVARIIAAV